MEASLDHLLQKNPRTMYLSDLIVYGAALGVMIFFYCIGFGKQTLDQFKQLSPYEADKERFLRGEISIDEFEKSIDSYLG